MSSDTAYENTYEGSNLVEVVVIWSADSRHLESTAYAYDANGDRVREAVDLGDNGTVDEVDLSTFDHHLVTRTEVHDGSDEDPVVMTKTWAYDQEGRVVANTVNYGDTVQADWLVSYTCE